MSQGIEIRLQCRRFWFDSWVRKIPWRRDRLPTPVFWPGEFHGLYSLRGRKESDTTEQLSLSQAAKDKEMNSPQSPPEETQSREHISDFRSLDCMR